MTAIITSAKACIVKQAIMMQFELYGARFFIA